MREEKYSKESYVIRNESFQFMRLIWNFPSEFFDVAQAGIYAKNKIWKKHCALISCRCMSTKFSKSGYATE